MPDVILGPDVGALGHVVGRRLGGDDRAAGIGNDAVDDSRIAAAQVQEDRTGGIIRETDLPQIERRVCQAAIKLFKRHGEIGLQADQGRGCGGGVLVSGCRRRRVQGCKSRDGGDQHRCDGNNPWIG